MPAAASASASVANPPISTAESRGCQSDSASAASIVVVWAMANSGASCRIRSRTGPVSTAGAPAVRSASQAFEPGRCAIGQKTRGNTALSTPLSRNYGFGPSPRSSTRERRLFLLSGSHRG